MARILIVAHAPLASALAGVARSLGLGEWLRLGKGGLTVAIH